MASWEAPDSFAEFVRGRHRELLVFGYALTGSRHEAEDLVQHALERAGIGWKRIEADNPEGYVRVIMVNRSRNVFRSRRCETLVDRMPDGPALHDSEAVSSGLVSALAELPRRQRMAVVLRYLAGWSDQQIAAQLGVTPGSVRSNISRALRRLRYSVDSRDSFLTGNEV